MKELSVTDPHFHNTMQAYEALYGVIDPELFVNIVDLGLVYGIEFSGKTIEVQMTLSTPACPMGEAITNGVRNAMELAFPEHSVHIDLTFDPPWSYEMMTDEGRRQLSL